VYVALGEFNTSTVNDCVYYPNYEAYNCAPPVQEIGIEWISKHPDWSPYRRPTSYQNDIAVIKLKHDVELTEFVYPICLPDKSLELRDGTKMVAAGWGITEFSRNSNVKLKVVLPKFPRGNCSIVFKLPLSESQICAGGVHGKDACRGDSGGPLMAIDKTKGVWYLIGIISLGNKDCGKQGIPGIYTYVPKYIDWILQKIK